MSGEYSEVCSIAEAVARLNEMGANRGKKGVRLLCKNLASTRGAYGELRYKWADIEDAWRKSFKTPKQRLGIKERAQG